LRVPESWALMTESPFRGVRPTPGQLRPDVRPTDTIPPGGLESTAQSCGAASGRLRLCGDILLRRETVLFPAENGEHGGAASGRGRLRGDAHSPGLLKASCAAQIVGREPHIDSIAPSVSAKTGFAGKILSIILFAARNDFVGRRQRIALSVSEGTGLMRTVPSLTLRVIRRRRVRLMDTVCGSPHCGAGWHPTAGCQPACCRRAAPCKERRCHRRAGCHPAPH